MKKFSFIMLLYNEEEFIKKSLNSIGPYADEIVIGNNECTDNSVFIVKDFCFKNNIPVKVIDISLTELYENGFAWAKNKLIETSEGNAIYVLDGDEELIMPHSVEDLISKDCYSITTITFKNMGDYIIRQDSFFTETHKRIFNKDSGIRYVGLIHEVLSKDKSPVDSCYTEIIHQHYTQFKRKNKQRIQFLYSALLLKAYKNPDLRFGINDYWFDVVVKNNFEKIENENKLFLELV